VDHTTNRADERAALLLRRYLTDDEYEQFRRSAYVDVRSPRDPDRWYRIPARPDMDLVWMYQGGRVVRRLCVQPVAQRLPAADLVLMHKFYIQVDEELYLATARRYPATPIRELARMLREASRARDLSLLPSMFE